MENLSPYEQRPVGPNLWQRLGILALGGAVGGTAGDFLHVTSQTTSYPPPAFPLPVLGVPYWVPFLFGAATLCIGLTHPWLDSVTGARYAPRAGLDSRRRVLGGLGFLLVTWAATAFLPWSTGGAKDAVVALLAIGAWAALDRTWTGLGLGLLTAGIGTAFEIAISGAGVFGYTSAHQNFYGVASWLPWLYFCASVTVGNLGRWLAVGLNPARATAPARQA